MADDLSNWTPRPKPRSDSMEGRFVRLERLDPARHADGLFEASAQPDGDQRFRWLPNQPPTDRAAFRAWVEQSAASEDPLFFAVIDKASGKVRATSPGRSSISPALRQWSPRWKACSGKRGVLRRISGRRSSVVTEKNSGPAT